MLNTNYFKHVHTETQDGFTYQGFVPLGNPMMLFSEIDGSPLASLHLAAQDTDTQRFCDGTRGVGLFTERPSDDKSRQLFQGMLNKDKQDFQFAITNLADNGFINFNIMRTDDKVMTVNPRGLNEINELRPGETYEIKCDLENNLSLILSSIQDGDGSKLTVKADEKNAEEKKEKKKGTYFYLSVVPQINCKELVEKFAKTTWKCVNYFLKKTPEIKAVPYALPVAMPAAHLHNMIDYGHDLAEEADLQHEVLNEDDEEDEIVNFSYRAKTENKKKAYRDENDGDRCVNLCGYEKTKPRYIKSCNDTLCLEEKGDFDTVIECKSQTKSAPAPAPVVLEQSATIFQNSKKQLDLDIVMNSHASEIKYGKHVDVQSYQSGIEYSYDVASHPCLISLSVQEKLEFMPTPEAKLYIEGIKELIKQFVEKKYDEFLKGKLFVDSNCCICFDENPDTLFYQCGHLATHASCTTEMNLTKCPLCSMFITAKLKNPFVKQVAAVA